MQVTSKTRRLVRVLRKPSPVFHNSDRVNSPSINASEASSLISSPLLLRYLSSSVHVEANYRGDRLKHSLICSSITPSAVFYSSDAGGALTAASESVKDLSDQIQKSILEKRSAPPNSWLWSMIEKCANREDIKILFDILQKLRVFKLSNLRIHENFNCAFCQAITKACVRAGAIDYAKKGLWKHNVYGLTPTIGSAHQLLLHAQQHRDAKLMLDTMKLVKKNDLPMQPGTADIVFSICYDTDKWDLISKYGKRFVKAGVNLRRAAFDIWMRFATNRGDVDSLWKIEKFRSESIKQHSLVSGVSCAKGFLLERKPEDAAEIIQVLNQSLSDVKRPGVMVELQKLVSEWPLEVLKHQKEENRKKALAAALRDDIPVMFEHLSKLGIEVDVSMDDLIKKEGVLC